MAACGGAERTSGTAAPTDASTAVESATLDGGVAALGCGLCLADAESAPDVDSPCADGGPFFVRVEGDGPPQTLSLGGLGTPPQCDEAALGYPVGAILSCGEGCGGNYAVWACATTDGGASTFFADVDAVRYVDALGRLWTGDGSVTYSTPWGPIGTAIEGSYSVALALASAADGGSTLTLNGAFRVCHAFDAPPAP